MIIATPQKWKRKFEGAIAPSYILATFEPIELDLEVSLTNRAALAVEVTCKRFCASPALLPKA